MKDRKRPAYIEKQLKEVNDFLRNNKVQDDWQNPLFSWWCNYLSDNGWYRGFNVHIDRYVETSEGKKLIRALAGPPSELTGEDKENWYNQIW